MSPANAKRQVNSTVKFWCSLKIKQSGQYSPTDCSKKTQNSGTTKTSCFARSPCNLLGDMMLRQSILNSPDWHPACSKERACGAGSESQLHASEPLPANTHPSNVRHGAWLIASLSQTPCRHLSSPSSKPHTLFDFQIGRMALFDCRFQIADCRFQLSVLLSNYNFQNASSIVKVVPNQISHRLEPLRCLHKFRKEVWIDSIWVYPLSHWDFLRLGPLIDSRTGNGPRDRPVATLEGSILDGAAWTVRQ